jgi:hypothetical protein
MKTKTVLIIFAVSLLTLFACGKLKNLIESASTDLIDDDAVTQVALDDINSSVDIATGIVENLGLVKGTQMDNVVAADSCPTITVTPLTPGTFPKTITINYGTGCSGFYNSTRSGKIIIVVTGKRNSIGSTRTTTFENYYFNGIKVEGTHVLTALPLHGNNPVFSVTLTGGKLTLPDGKTVERTVDHQREWVAGFNTPKNVWDDECLITGTASGKGINGKSYTNTILTALYWKKVCEFIVSGSIKFERTGVEPIVLDYGSGVCDAKAIVTRGDQSKEITLRHKYRTMQ